MAATAFSFISTGQLADDPAPPIRWLWPDYLATGMITLLTSRWKAGKTTLISVMLARLKAGGSLAGTPVSPGRALVLSEEPAALWAERHHRLNFGPHVQLCCRPFRGLPSREEWSDLIAQACAAAPDLVVIDPLAMFLPGNVENTPSLLLEALAPLRTLTDRGTAVLLVHHPRKNSSKGELSPRGSGALTGYVDIILELDRPPTASATDRQRRLRSTSRLHGEVQRVMELNQEGTDYALCEPPAEPDSFDGVWVVLKMVFEDSCERLTRLQIFSRWPSDQMKPSRLTLWRWLDRALSEGRIACTGQGRRYDPFRYALLGRTDLLPDLEPIRDLREQEYDAAVRVREADAAAAAMLAKASAKRS